MNMMNEKRCSKTKVGKPQKCQLRLLTEVKRMTSQSTELELGQSSSALFDKVHRGSRTHIQY